MSNAPKVTCPTCHQTRSACALHCAGCCRTFGGLSGFDSHRKNDGDRRICMNPTEVGLTQSKPGVWSRPYTKEMA